MKLMIPKYKPLVLALDNLHPSDAIKVVHELKDCIDVFKLNSIVWNRQLQRQLTDYICVIDEIHDAGKKVFLDMKFHDIPSTMEAHVRERAEICEFFTFHLSAGRKTCEEMAKYSSAVGVSVLTSITKEDLVDLYNFRSYSPFDLAIRIVACGDEYGITQFVCSPREISHLKEIYPKHTFFVPGISLEGQPNQSQEVSAKWDQPIRDGADYIIMGRSILNLPRDERKGVIEKINAETERIRNEQYS
jgi:orotidine-5'-phosphate decarboxylase